MLVKISCGSLTCNSSIVIILIGTCVACQVFDYVQKYDGFVDRLLRHLNTSAMMDLLLQIVVAPDTNQTRLDLAQVHIICDVSMRMCNCSGVCLCLCVYGLRVHISMAMNCCIKSCQLSLYKPSILYIIMHCYIYIISCYITVAQ